MSVPLSPIEERARALIATFLGVPVTQHDDQTAPSLPDLRIEYPDRPHAVVEIVCDIQQARAGQHAALDQRGDWFEAPGLTRSWGAQLSTAARIGDVHKKLPAILAAAEAAGDDRVTALPWSGLDPRGYELFRLGVEWAWSRPGPGPVMLLSPNSCSWDGDPNMLTQWCVAVLAREADVPAKLAASPYTERHAFIFASTAGDLQAYRALMDKEHPARPGEPFQLPTLAPTLPPGVDGVWACGERTIAWLPRVGWVDATPPPQTYGSTGQDTAGCEADGALGLFEVPSEAAVVLPSPAEVAAAQTTAGGWSQATLAGWGVPWPPPKGWRQDLERRWGEVHR